MDIAEFLAAVFDEEQQLAEAVGVERFEAVDYLWESKYLLLKQADGTTKPTTEFDAATAEFIAAHDPSQVLADLAAKRRILARHARGGDEWMARWHPDCCVGCGHTGEHADPRTRHVNDCPELRDLAAPYAHHPDFDPSWAVDAAD